jgi:hypothetical protein
LPDLPVLGDFVAGYESSAWYGLGAPKHTPSEIVATLNTEINAGLANSTIKARLTDLGSTPLVGSATDFGKLIADDQVDLGLLGRGPSSPKLRAASGMTGRNWKKRSRPARNKKLSSSLPSSIDCPATSPL